MGDAIELDASYATCRRIAETSNSNFYRTFQFLRLDRRKSMEAIYAFSRLADDATDGPVESTSNTWEADRWLQWIDSLGSTPLKSPTPSLNSIAPALSDSLHRFGIPNELLKQIVLGVDSDTHILQLDTYSDLQRYMYRVASAVGLCCIAIWSPTGLPDASSWEWQAAVECGHAFQLTNILRDVVEDSNRNRIYLAAIELKKFGFTPGDLMKALAARSSEERIQSVQSMGNWKGLIEVYLQRANGCYQRGRKIIGLLEPDGRRMFSMMWTTYREILRKIESDPLAPLRGRVRLNSTKKLAILAKHSFTPWFQSLSVPKDSDSIRFTNVHPIPNPRVAVIGGGLAGIQTALHLVRHGCDTTLFESRNRLGGRVGSFADLKSQQPLDYCQHVGMVCCKELVGWIENAGQQDDWERQSVLWFRSRNGKPFRVSAWPLPAPLHLSGLLWKWPDLSLLDRLGVAKALGALVRTRPTPSFSKQLAVDWLHRQRQSDNAIRSFWTTILVSALGEQLTRVSMGSVHKVMVDGFAASRDAFHLLVPKRSLTELIDQASRQSLEHLNVNVRTGETVSSITPGSDARWRVQCRGIHPSNNRSEESSTFDAIVFAVPWHRTGELLRSVKLPESGFGQRRPYGQLELVAQGADSLESSPITGVHTWWSKPWLNTPHSILIDRLSQWVFPGPSPSSDHPTHPPNEHYYQIVISGSRDLPKGNSEELIKLIESDLQEVFPEIQACGSKLLRGKVVTDPQSVFSVRPGQESARPSSGAVAELGLFLAGDWTETGWPATMEGALRSGSFAAEEALAYLGRPARISKVD